MRKKNDSCFKQKPPESESESALNRITQFENHHLTIQFPTTLLSFQSWRFNSPINKKKTPEKKETFQHGKAIEVLKWNWNFFYWNLNRLFMMRKWLLQKKDWKRFQMNKFSCFFIHSPGNVVKSCDGACELWVRNSLFRIPANLGEEGEREREGNSVAEKNLLKCQNRKLKNEEKSNNLPLSIVTVHK